MRGGLTRGVVSHQGWSDKRGGLSSGVPCVDYICCGVQAGPNIRHKCLQTILRMIYYASPDLLRQVLKTQPVSR